MPLASVGDLLQLEDLHLPGLRGLVEDDVRGDPVVEPGPGLLLAGLHVLLVGARDEPGHGRVAHADDGPADDEEDEPPGHEVGGDGHEDAAHGEEREDGRRKGLVAEVGHGEQQGDDLVVDLAEVLHAVLQVAHVAEEVLAELLDGPHRGRGGERRTARRVPHVLLAGERPLGRGRVPGEEAGDEDAEQEDDDGQDGDEVRVEAYEGVDGEQRHGPGGDLPGQQVPDADLELEHDAYAGIEAAEIVGHCGDIEVGSLRVGGRRIIGAVGASILVGRDDLLEEPVGLAS